jgi:hypothetical protein
VQEYLTEDNCASYPPECTALPQLIQLALDNLRPIGVISWLERKLKVDKYIQKKRKRVWKKKINYDCRKRVADNRLRVKGRFATKKQACDLLGFEGLPEDQLKLLLSKKKSK